MSLFLLCALLLKPRHGGDLTSLKTLADIFRPLSFFQKDNIHVLVMQGRTSELDNSAWILLLFVSQTELVFATQKYRFQLRMSNEESLNWFVFLTTVRDPFTLWDASASGLTCVDFRRNVQHENTT